MYCICARVCVHAHIHVKAHTWSSEHNLQDLLLFFHHGTTWNTGLKLRWPGCSSHSQLYSLNHLPAPLLFIYLFFETEVFSFFF